MVPSHAVSVLLDDGLLAFNRAIGVVRRRNLPIEGVGVGPSHLPGVLRLTFLMQADEASAVRLLRQLQKTHGVREAAIFPAADAVTREVALIKVKAPAGGGDYADFLAVVSRFQATVVDESSGTIIVENGGDREATLSLIQALERFGIVEIARSGTLALRGAGGPSRSLNHPSEAVL